MLVPHNWIRAVNVLRALGCFGQLWRSASTWPAHPMARAPCYEMHYNPNEGYSKVFYESRVHITDRIAMRSSNTLLLASRKSELPCRGEDRSCRVPPLRESNHGSGKQTCLVFGKWMNMVIQGAAMPSTDTIISEKEHTFQHEQFIDAGNGVFLTCATSIQA